VVLGPDGRAHFVDFGARLRESWTLSLDYP
jgi:hypothetical protein